ncbi:hypothetical protein ST47_g9416 [Ascochyta rabiei]|uniref:Uncharacterized protein n=2 Tax=Didymella rabiei TaxID=5454 RepID=A0A162XA54_DIDRA|nr:hypothetical protein ST47_g9416 [Ascochyta rabiei]
MHQSQMPTTRTADQDPRAGSFRSTQKASSPQAGGVSVVLRYEKHQDIIPVNSVENEENRQQLTGVKHYLHMMSQLGLNAKPSLDHIDYRSLGGAQDATDTVFDETSSHIPPTTQPLPSPPSSLPDYNQSIYFGTTQNPVVFLSILRIAQHNLPSLDLSSALNHLPNMHASDTLPRLHPSAPGNLAPLSFIDALPALPRTDKVKIHVAFLPAFYADARHSIGYFEILLSPRGAKKVGVCLFSPCAEEDLRRYGLVEYLQGRDDDGAEGMRRVGAGLGYWVTKDTVEEYEEWSLAWRIAQRVWEGRLKFARGVLEG